MGSRAELGSQVRIVFHFLKRSRRAVVAELADFAVDGGVFSKLLHSGSKHDEVGAVRQRHAGAVNGLVSQPGAVKLLRIEVDNGFVDGLIEQLNVDLHAQFRSQAKALHVIAHEQASDYELAGLVGPDDCQDIHDGDIAEKLVRGPIEDAAHWIIGSSHNPLHAHHCSQVVAAIDAERAGRTYQ